MYTNSRLLVVASKSITMGLRPEVGLSLTIIHHVVTIDNVDAGIDVLEASTPGAFYNFGERFVPPKCHPETRIHILTKIMNWMVGEEAGPTLA